MYYILKNLDNKKIIISYFLLGLSIVLGAFFSSLDTADIFTLAIKNLCLFACSLIIAMVVISLIQSIMNYKCSINNTLVKNPLYYEENYEEYPTDNNIEKIIIHKYSISEALKDYTIPVTLSFIIYLSFKHCILNYIPWASISLTLLSFFSIMIICSVFSIIIRDFSLISSLQEAFIITADNISNILKMIIISFLGSCFLFFTITLVAEFIADGALNRIVGIIFLVIFTSELLFYLLLLLLNQYLKSFSIQYSFKK